MTTEQNEVFLVNRTLLHAHLFLHVIVAGVAVGALVNIARSVLSYAAAVSLLFWAFALVLYPAAAIWTDAHGKPWHGARPLFRWVAQFTAAAAVVFLAIRYLGPR